MDVMDLIDERGRIGALPVQRWIEMATGSVPDSLRARRESALAVHRKMGRASVEASVAEYERRTMPSLAATRGWNDDDLARSVHEAMFAWNWVGVGSPIVMLTHSMAALLSVTKAAPVDFDTLPFPAFLVGVPHEYLPLHSQIARPVRWIGVMSVNQHNGVAGGSVCTIPDSDTLSNWVGVGHASKLSEELVGRASEWARLAGLAVRIASNVIAFLNEHRASPSSTVREVTSHHGSNVMEMRPPEGVVVDRAFRALAADLVAAKDFGGARRALAHLVRGHWRRQAVGEGRADRRLTWVRPFRRGDESLGTVIQRTIRLRDPRISDE